MKILYLGTGAAEGIPAAFCNCEFCRGAKARGEIRSRAQILIDGELSIDFPPDAFYHAARFGIDLSAIKYIFVTHAHMDHFYAHDFVLRGYKYAYGMTEQELHIFGNSEVKEIFEESTARELKPEIAPSIKFHRIGAFEEITFDDWKVYTFAAQHSSEEPLLFLLEKGGKRILHLSDTGALTAQSERFLSALGGKPADLITFDCTFLYGKTAPNARHMGLDENMRTLEKLERIGLADGHTQKVITHFSHNSAPTQELLKWAEEEFGVIAAYDGMEIKL